MKFAPNDLGSTEDFKYMGAFEQPHECRCLGTEKSNMLGLNMLGPMGYKPEINMNAWMSQTCVFMLKVDETAVSRTTAFPSI